MNKWILSASEFFLTESEMHEAISIANDWPNNWKDMPEWSQLQELGFRDATTPQMERNGNILLMNDRYPQYPGGLVLQRSGYIRNKQKEAYGYLKKYGRGFALKDMFDYLIQRFSRIARRKVKKNPAHGDFSYSNILFINKMVRGAWRFNPETQRIDTDVRVDLSRIKSVPEGIRFGVIKGDFICSNMGLTNLDIAPQSVAGSFDCSNNKLTSLVGGPQIVGQDYDCSANNLTTLEGAPVNVNGAFICNRNKLTSLRGAPRTVSTKFDFSNNPVTSFEYAPALENMKRWSQIIAYKTHLETLENMPIPDAGRLFLMDCKKLKSLKGLPDTLNSVHLGGIAIGLDDICYQLGVLHMSRPMLFRTIMEMLYRSDELVKNPGMKVHVTFDDDAVILISSHHHCSESERARCVKIFSTLLDETVLDAWILENPMDIDLLDSFPDIKAGVLQRTGLEDISDLARAMRRGLI